MEMERPNLSDWESDSSVFVYFLTPNSLAFFFSVGALGH